MQTQTATKPMISVPRSLSHRHLLFPTGPSKSTVDHLGKETPRLQRARYGDPTGRSDTDHNQSPRASPDVTSVPSPHEANTPSRKIGLQMTHSYSNFKPGLQLQPSVGYAVLVFCFGFNFCYLVSSTAILLWECEMHYTVRSKHLKHVTTE